MKALILYRANSEHGRVVDEFVSEFKHRTSKDLILLDVDTKEGANQAELYDVMQYPAVLTVRDDGQLAKSWVGTPLPLVNDVAGYLVGQ